MIQSSNDIRNEGYRVLLQKLGAANTAMFLRQFENGSGDYIQEHQSVLEENSIDAITERIKQRK